MLKLALVTGAAGFLGSHFVDRLIKDGYNVIGVDNLSTGNISKISHLDHSKSFKFVQGDIVDIKTLNFTKKIDLIANFACPASPPRYQKLAIETLDVCSTGVKNLLELARRNNARFFHTSTSEVYGDPSVHPQPESYWGNVNSYGERAMYDEGKRFAEAMIWIYRQKYQVNTGIVRIFNTYGPRMDPHDGRVVSTFVRQALAGEPLTVAGDGTHTRSFCYVDDEIEGLYRLATSDNEGPINIGSNKEFTILELAEIVNRVTGNKSGIQYIDRPVDDPSQRKPDISKANKLINWQPTTPLEEGIKKTIEWMKELK